MGEDIRLPIGALFTIIGAIMTIYGFVTNGSEMYAKIGSNINIWTGIGMLVFGLAFLAMVFLPAKKKKD
jgi:hypothetical protein